MGKVNLKVFWCCLLAAVIGNLIDLIFKEFIE